MRKIFISTFLLCAVVASACTNLIAGKKATTDGSVLCTYSADDYGMFIGLCHFPAGKHPKGTMRSIYDWDDNLIVASNGYPEVGVIAEYEINCTMG